MGVAAGGFKPRSYTGVQCSVLPRIGTVHPLDNAYKEHHVRQAGKRVETKQLNSSVECLSVSLGR